MEKFIGLEHGKKKMKTSIKIARLENKIADMEVELQLLKSESEEEVQLDSSEEYMEAAQPVAPAFRAGVKSGIEVGGQSEIVATEDIGGSDEIVDHEVTRGVQY